MYAIFTPMGQQLNFPQATIGMAWTAAGFVQTNSVLLAEKNGYTCKTMVLVKKEEGKLYAVYDKEGYRASDAFETSTDAWKDAGFASYAATNLAILSGFKLATVEYVPNEE